MTRSRQVLEDGQPRFDGGLNTVSDDQFLLPSQVREARNMRLTDYGALTKRSGVNPDAGVASQPLPASVQNGYCWRKDDGTIQYLAVVNGTLYVNGVSQVGTLATGFVSFAQFRDGTNDVVYIADGGLLNKWDGTTLTTDIGTVNTTFIKVHNRRLWACGNATTPDSIFYSGRDNGSTLADTNNGGGQIIVRTFADEAVVSLSTVGSSLLIFHRKGISRLTGFGQDDVEISPEGITSEVGIICPYAVVEGDDLVYFVTDRGVFAANESSVAPVGTPQSPDPLWPLVAAMSAADYTNVRGVLARQSQEILFFIPDSGVYAFHTILRAWAGPWNGPFLSCTGLWQAVGSANAEPYVQMGTSGGDVLEVKTSPEAPYARDTWSGSAVSGDSIEWLIRLRRLFFGDTALYKTFRFAYVVMTAPGGAAVTLDWSVDDGSTGQYIISGSTLGVWDDNNVWDDNLRWITSNTSRSYRPHLGNGGYFIDFTLSSSVDGAFIISSFKAEAFAMGRR